MKKKLKKSKKLKQIKSRIPKTNFEFYDIDKKFSLENKDIVWS